MNWMDCLQVYPSSPSLRTIAMKAAIYNSPSKHNQSTEPLFAQSSFLQESGALSLLPVISRGRRASAARSSSQARSSRAGLVSFKNLPQAAANAFLHPSRLSALPLAHSGTAIGMVMCHSYAASTRRIRPIACPS